MATTVISTTNVQNGGTFTLDAGDQLIVTTYAGMYWTGNSVLTYSAGATGTYVNLFGTLDFGTAEFAPNSAVHIGAAGSLSTLFGMTLHTGDLTNLGTIRGGPNNFALTCIGGQNDIQNLGTITGDLGVALGLDQGSNDFLNNQGTISATNIALSMNGPYGQLVNSGLITGVYIGVEVGGEVFVSGVGFGPTNIRLRNTGAIESDFYGIKSNLVNPSSNLTFLNEGTLRGDYLAFLGGAGADNLRNTGTIFGNVSLGGGDDRFDTFGGSVIGTVEGGLGADTYATDNADLAIYETGTDIDTVYAGVSFRLFDLIENLILLGTGDFRAYGNGGVNQMVGNAGDNRMSGLAGADTINGDLGNDRVFGGDQADSLSGDDGDDTLTGNLGNDTLRGGDGDDVLIGGAGKDLLTAGAGADVIVFASTSHSSNALSNADIISDFTQAEDIIDLAAIDANSINFAPNDKFTFIGDALFSNVAGQLRFEQNGGNTYLWLDTDGSGTAEAIIRLNGLLTLNASDFVL